MVRIQQMIVKQLLVGQLSVFSYIIGCEETRKAMLVDPAFEVDRILKAAADLDLSPKYIFNTHAHPDHIAGNARVQELTGAQIVMSGLEEKLLNTPEGRHMARAWGIASSPPVDVPLGENQTFFELGRLKLKILHTPGHSPGSLCLMAQGQLFTGDVLFVGSGGRTDLPGGDLHTLLRSIRQLMDLPEETIVWPGHHYGPTASSTIGQEKRTNMYVLEFDLLSR